MRRFLVARGAKAVVVIALVTTFAFILVHLAPGDPFGANLDDPTNTAALHAQQVHQWGYDQPLPVQFVKWFGNLMHGEFGWSHSRNRSVAEVLWTTIPRTVLLMGTALIVGVLAGVALGTWQALRHGSPTERVVGTIALAVRSVPEFLLALAALVIFAARWRWFPVSGIADAAAHDSMTLAGRIADTLRHLALPAGTLATLIAVSVSRYQRSAMLAVLPEEYMRTARAIGADEFTIVRHALRNALGPLVTIIGLLIPTLFGGAVFAETIFNWPGVGRMMVEAVSSSDYSLVLAGVLIGSALVALASALTDMLAAIANPRLRVGE